MANELKTRCPHCQTTFRVQKNQLEAASGMVRCGKCYQAFNGFKCLLESERAAPGAAPPDNDDDFLIDDNFDLSRLDRLDDPPTPAPEETPPTDIAGKKTLASGSEAVDSGPGGSGPEDFVFDAGSPVTESGEELEELSLDQRDMSRWRPETHNIIPDAGLIGRRPGEHRRPWLWIAGSAAAACALAVQLLYFNSLSIGRDSVFRPLAATLCPVLGCPLARQVDVEKILSTNLVIRNHPDVDDALLVDAVIVNTAEFAQPFPPLTLAFENLQGKTVARRTFNPAEYLTGELAGLAAMPARQPVKLELEIVDPGTGAVSFRFFVAK